MFSSELLPAPFGPITAQIADSRTLKLTLDTARTPPKAKVRPAVSRISVERGRIMSQDSDAGLHRPHGVRLAVVRCFRQGRGFGGMAVAALQPVQRRAVQPLDRLPP